MAGDRSPLERVRELCLSFPETTERLSHGQPTWFVRDKKTFVMYLDNHHDDGRLALWCAAPEGMQAALVDGEPEHYFVPPYVGHRGWLGVRLDRELGVERDRGGDRGGVCDHRAAAAGRTGRRGKEPCVRASLAA